MTTIALYDGWLAADGRYTDGNEILDDECQKIVRDRDDGLITCGAGEGGPLELFMRGDFWDKVKWLPGGGPVFTKAQYKKFKECTGWVYKPGDKFVHQTGLSAGGFDPLPIKGGLPQAIGSGSVYFKAAMASMLMYRDALGLTSRQMIMSAMDVSMDMDLYSGGKVTILRLK